MQEKNRNANTLEGKQPTRPRKKVAKKVAAMLYGVRIVAASTAARARILAWMPHAALLKGAGEECKHKKKIQKPRGRVRAGARCRSAQHEAALPCTAAEPPDRAPGPCHPHRPDRKPRRGLRDVPRRTRRGTRRGTHRSTRRGTRRERRRAVQPRCRRRDRRRRPPAPGPHGSREILRWRRARSRGAQQRFRFGEPPPLPVRASLRARGSQPQSRSGASEQHIS